MSPCHPRLFDVSKQVVGQMFVHGVNVFISDVGSARSSGNACVFYFLNILIDTTLGVGAIYLTLHLLTWIFTTKLHFKGFLSGQYGSPPSLNYWARQATVYVVSLTSMKLLVILLLVSWHKLIDIGAWLLGWLGNSDAAQVVFTMGLFPIFMNIIQFWLIDSIVKAGGFAGIALPTDQADAADREPLFRSSSDSGDDDDDDSADVDGVATPVKGDIEAQEQVGLLRRSAESRASHTYPPSLNNPPTAAPTVHRASLSPPPTTGSVLSARRQRPPPAPLLPRSPMVPALNSPDPSSVASAGTGPGARPEEDWQAWNGDGDWVERIGEEEWTGRRAGARKREVDGVWHDEA